MESFFKFLWCKSGGKVIFGSSRGDLIDLKCDSTGYPSGSLRPEILIEGYAETYDGVSFIPDGYCSFCTNADSAMANIYGGTFYKGLYLHKGNNTVYKATILDTPGNAVYSLTLSPTSGLSSYSSAKVNGQIVSLQTASNGSLYIWPDTGEITEIVYTGRPIINKNPEDASIVANGTSALQFSTDVLFADEYSWLVWDGDGSTAYAWTNVAAHCSYTGTDSNTLKIVPKSGDTWLNGKKVYCYVKNTSSGLYCTTGFAYITVKAAYAIQKQPVSSSCSVGGSMNFSVEATGVARYQWMITDTDGQDYDWSWLVSQGHVYQTEDNESSITITPKDDWIDGRYIVCYMYNASGNYLGMTEPAQMSVSGDVALTSIAVTGLVKPVVGAHPSKSITVKANNNSNIPLFVQTAWIKYDTVKYTRTTMSSSDVFEAGNYRYWMKIEITAADGYTFPYSEELNYDDEWEFPYLGTLTMNGEKKSAWLSNPPKTMTLIWYNDAAEAGSPSVTAPEKVGKVTVANAATGVKLSWTAAEGADGYYIFRKAEGGSFMLYYSTNDITESDTSVFSGTKYTYYICSYKKGASSDIMGEKSAEVSIVYLAPSKISSTANTSTSITVKWTAVTGADGYFLYRSDDGGSSYNRIKTVSGLSYTDPDSKTNGKKYAYKVVSYKKVDGVTYKGKSSSAKVQYFVSRPTISSLTSTTATKALVKWNKNSSATGYHIQYSLKSDFSSGNKTVTITSNSTVSKTLTGLTSKKKYYVRVRSYKTVADVKYYSAYSASKYITVK